MGTRKHESDEPRNRRDVHVIYRRTKTRVAFTWAQTFSYDPFGNISKSGSISWQPTYSTASNNQYQSGWNGASYDADGNLLNDTFNTYTWNAYGDLASANGAAATYDAFDRMVENHGGTNQYAYSPGGTQPLATLTGQTLSIGFVPLPGGAVAIYYSPNLLHQYNHPDWLGSIKLFSTPGRTTIGAMSYAPFGEGYAGGAPWVQFTSAGSAFTVYDTENQSGSLTDFTFRRYSPVQGRWISPDPAGLAAVNPANPQTWNRYAYVANNPLSYVDPLGLFRALPGQCQGGQGICPDEGAGVDPSSLGGVGGYTLWPVLEWTGESFNQTGWLLDWQGNGQGGSDLGPCYFAGPCGGGEAKNTSSPCGAIQQFNQTASRVIAAGKALVNGSLAAPKILGGVLGELIPGLEAPSSYELWNGFWQGVNAGENTMFAVTGNATYQHEASSAIAVGTASGLLTYGFTGNVEMGATVGSFENATSPVDAVVTLVELAEKASNVPCQSPTN